jgi:serine-type D-Ala-D-Ala carboxypeptidase (penicillin-binding protein 5/6)
MRLPARLTIAALTVALAVAVAGSVAGCSTNAGLAFDGGGGRSPSAAATARIAPGTEAIKTAPASPAIEVTGAPAGVKAKAGILADATTGQVLWADNANAERPIASITKVMTALLVIRAGDLNRKITVPKAVLNYVAKYDGNSVGLVPGQTLTADQLLYALLLESACDAAYTLATAYGPGLPAFVAQMNALAAQLGLTQTHFTSPDGLPYPTEYSTYSTPADLVKLGEIAMRYPEFSSIVGTQYYNVPKGDGHGHYWFGNDNALIGSYPGAVGIKTGFTDAAGHCLLFEVVRGGRTLIGVVLDSPPTGPNAGAQDAAKVLNWGFALKQAG